MQSRGISEPKLRLIRNIKAHPELYKTDEPAFQTIQRAEKQRLWDRVARRSGIVKTEYAKSKWRSLILYFRNHMDNVAKKKIRRYIPNTGNPEDKYVQMGDWQYYEDMKFMEPYINLSPLRRLNKSWQVTSIRSKWDPNENISKAVACPATKLPAVTKAVTNELPTIPTTKTQASDSEAPHQLQVQIGNLIVEIEVNNKNPLKLCNETARGDSNAATSIAVAAGESVTDDKPTRPTMQLSTPFNELSINDQNLKVFFDAMLCSTQRLPKFQQDRVKVKLRNIVRAQKHNGAEGP